MLQKVRSSIVSASIFGCWLGRLLPLSVKLSQMIIDPGVENFCIVLSLNVQKYDVGIFGMHYESTFIEVGAK